MFKQISMLILIILSLFSQSAAFAQSREKLPNDFGIELLGKSLIYTFTFQRMLTNPVGLEAGLSVLGGGSSTDNTTIVFMPVGAKLYFIPKNGSPFITGGGVLVTASVKSGPFSDSASDTYTYAGFGFEFRSTGGFLFRGTAYGLFSSGSFFIWPGLHIGYAF
jgi:hypothetical protein